MGKATNTDSVAFRLMAFDMLANHVQERMPTQTVSDLETRVNAVAALGGCWTGLQCFGAAQCIDGGMISMDGAKYLKNPDSNVARLRTVAQMNITDPSKPHSETDPFVFTVAKGWDLVLTDMLKFSVPILNDKDGGWGWKFLAHLTDIVRIGVLEPLFKEVLFASVLIDALLRFNLRSAGSVIGQAIIYNTFGLLKVVIDLVSVLFYTVGDLGCVYKLESSKERQTRLEEEATRKSQLQTELLARLKQSPLHTQESTDGIVAPGVSSSTIAADGSR